METFKNNENLRLVTYYNDLFALKARGTSLSEKISRVLADHIVVCVIYLPP